MAKASSGALSTVILDPTDEQYVKSFREAQASLQEALDNRNNQLFDPTLLAISQALGSPTKTGSFGEVIGNVAGAIGTAQQAEEKRAQDIAKMRFDMAQQNFMMNRRDQAARMLAPPQAGASAGAAGTPAGTPASGAPAGGGAAPSGGAETPAVPKPAGLAQYDHITPQLALQIGLRDPELGKQAMQYLEAVNAQRKLAQDAVRTTEKGTYVIDPSKPGGVTFTPAPGGDYVTRFIPSVGNTLVTREDAMKLDAAKDVLSRTPDDADAQKELTRIISKTRGPQKGTPTGPMTPTEAELAKKQSELTGELRTKSDEARYEDIISKGVLAGAQIPRYRNLYRTVTGPNAEQYLGVFRGPKFSEAIGLLVEGSVPNIREAFTNVGLDKEIKAEQLAVAQQVALINTEMRKILRSPGEGAQSDMENRLALAAGVEMTDPAKGMAKKIKFLEAKAEFENQVATELRKSNMNATDFILSGNSKYQQLLQNYERKLGQVLGLTPQQVRPAQGAAGSFDAQRQKLNQTLGIVKP